MATYLLLRNNKESGPYSLEALIQLGLKPYDLVWVEGRSAAWRYPSEVEDLKFYAAAVEEQPFDRFYKRPSEEKKEKQQPVIQHVIAETVHEQIQEIKKVEAEEQVEVNIPKKQVYVSMPANSGKTVIIKKSEQAASVAATTTNSINNSYNKIQEPVKTAEPVIESYSPSYSELVNDYNKQQYFEKKATLSQTPKQSDPEPLETKYSQSLDDIKDMYVQTLTDRKKKTAQRKMMLTLVKKVLPFAAVLIAGILMGVFIMNKNTGKDVSQQIQPVNTAVQNADANKKDATNAAATNGVAQPNQSVQVPEENKPVETNATDASKQAAVQADNALTTTKKNSKKENKPASITDNSNTPLVQPKSVETDPATGERNKVVRSETDNNTQTASKPFANPLMKQVTVASNDYKRGTFGGIHDLQLTVNNNSNYLLDNVVVELQFLKPNDQPLKTDNVRFSPVPPNGSLTLAIPATSRGVKVAYKIIHVESKSASNDTAGLK